MTTFIISNEKGGVGKSTTAVNLSHGLALRGRSVLLIDFDPQGSASKHLGFKPQPMTRRLLLVGETVSQIAVEVRPNLDIISSDATLADVRDWLMVTSGRDRDSAWEALDSAIEPARKDYDYIVVDCSPGLDILKQAALAAGHYLLIPVSVDYLSTDAVDQQMRTLQVVQKAGYEIDLAYILPTKYYGSQIESRQAMKVLKEKYGDHVTEPIRGNTAVQQAAAYGESIFEYAPTSNGAQDYSKFVELIDNAKA